MHRHDYSKTIYDTFYSTDKPLKITLKNGAILIGALIGFFHGDPNNREPFVIRWHYVGSGEESLKPIGEGIKGAILEQEDIAKVEFTGS
jgi:hypothetical protein